MLLYRYTPLIWTFAQRELKSRFRTTAAGWLWSLVVPLATLLTYTVVFSVVFRTQPPAFGSGREGNYAAWLFIGLVTWAGATQPINAAIGNLLGSGSLLQKIYVPSFVPVLGTVVAGWVQTLIEFAIALGVLLAFGNVGATWLLLPAVLILLAIFSASIATIFAILNVFARDISHIVMVALQLLFFLTPVIYPLDVAPESWHGLPVRTIIQLSPFTDFVVAVRSVVYDLAVPSTGVLLGMLAWTVGMAALAVIVYRVRGRDIAEAL